MNFTRIGLVLAALVTFSGCATHNYDYKGKTLDDVINAIPGKDLPRDTPFVYRWKPFEFGGEVQKAAAGGFEDWCTKNGNKFVNPSALRDSRIDRAFAELTPEHYSVVGAVYKYSGRETQMLGYCYKDSRTIIATFVVLQSEVDKSMRLAYILPEQRKAMEKAIQDADYKKYAPLREANDRKRQQEQACFTARNKELRMNPKPGMRVFDTNATSVSLFGPPPSGMIVAVKPPLVQIQASGSRGMTSYWMPIEKLSAPYDECE